MSNIFLNIFFACSLVYFCSANGNDYQWGTIGATDTLMAREVITKPGFLGTITTEDYVFRQTGVTTPRLITAIKVHDKKKLRGANAVISSGGVGSNAVTIKFSSPRGTGIKSIVEVYGAI